MKQTYKALALSIFALSISSTAHATTGAVFGAGVTEGKAKVEARVGYSQMKHS